MKNRVGVLICVFLLSAFVGYAQSKLIVSAPDSLPFLLFVDDSQINTAPVSSIQLYKMTVGKHNLKVVVQAQEAMLLFTSKNLISHSFSLSVLNNKLELVPSGELKLQAKSFQLWKKGAVPAQKDDFVYRGEMGCEKPASDAQVDSLVAVLQSKSFDTERKMIARMHLQESCFLVKDIMKIISTIELEENRMECIVTSLNQVYDLERINELLELAILERNKEAIQQRISQLQEH